MGESGGMGELGCGNGDMVAVQLRKRAKEAFRESDLGKVFETLGVGETDEAAEEALKTVLAGKAADYMMKAIQEAKKRGMEMGAAAIIIAAEKDEDAGQ